MADLPPDERACPGCTKSYDNIHCHKSGIRISTCKPFLRKSNNQEKDPESVNIVFNKKTSVSNVVQAAIMSKFKKKQSDTCGIVYQQNFAKWTLYIWFRICVTDIDEVFFDTIWNFCVVKLAHLLDRNNHDKITSTISVYSRRKNGVKTHKNKEFKKIS